MMGNTDHRCTRIPPQSGAGFRLRQGEVLRVIDPDGEQVSDLFAFCIAQGLDAGPQDWTEAPDCFPAKLAQSLGLKMGDWWRPTVDSFFGKVTKATMLHSVKEAGGSSFARQKRRAVATAWAMRAW